MVSLLLIYLDAILRPKKGSTPVPASLIQFEDFEVDVSRFELRRAGRPLKLEKLPMNLLLLLVWADGRLVTREEIQEKLWGKEVYVDSEHGINTAIRKIRQVLGDDPDNPRFVQTVQRKGYRFVAATTDGLKTTRNGDRAAGSNGQADHTALGGNGAAGLVHPVATGAAVTPTPLFLLRRPVTWIEAAVLLLLLWPAYRFVTRQLGNRSAARVTARSTADLPPRNLPGDSGEHHLEDGMKDTIVVADFANNTGDAIFDDTLRTALNISLRQSPFLNVLSESEVAKTLRLMTRPSSTKLTPEVARELCQRAGSKAYLAGSIGSLGSEYVLGLKAVNCQSGDTLAEEQVTAASKEKVLDTLGEAASKLRGELGESLATVQKLDVPLTEATTTSLEALKAYSLGTKAINEKGRPAAALPFDRRAIQLDPDFAVAYTVLGDIYVSLGEPERGSKYYTKAFQLRKHASEWEKLQIEANYYSHVTGELDKAAQTFQESIESYPRYFTAYVDLGTTYAEQGKYEKAAEITRQALRLGPNSPSDLYGNLACFALNLQHFDEARQMIGEAQARKYDFYVLHGNLYAIAFLGADSTAMAEQQRWFAANEFQSYGLALASDTEAYGGHLGKARELTKRAAASVIRADGKEVGAIWQANAALEQVAYGNRAEARQWAAEALKLAPKSQAVESEAALAFSMVGDTARAQLLEQDLNERFPLDTQIQSLWLPAIQAELALDKKIPSAALKALQAASTAELANIPFVSNTSCLYHVYVRGEAYLAAGQGDAAAAEFQKILDHGGIVWNCWTGALAHLGVARGNALVARTSQGADADAARLRALAAYKDLLTLWKDADPDIPILQQAKAEYAKLQ
jgi:DNA-binding winged helix-turn-helix (wHTH) protein/tetratricopeptide (TPR) repeat protein